MYKQITADACFLTPEGSSHNPVATLTDGNGGRAHWIIDDHCYVLYLKVNGKYTRTAWIFAEAVEALRTLPPLVKA